MVWLALLVVFDLSPPVVSQGQVSRVTAPANAVSVRIGERSVPLFPSGTGARTGLIPVPALQPVGPQNVEAVDTSGNVIATATLTVRDARFRSQNVRLGRGLTSLKPSPGEMETVAALRNTVSPVRYWSEPLEIPTAGCMTSPFGVRRLHNGKPTGRYHSGIDQRGAEGAPIRAIAGGTVRIVRKFNIHGDLVGIDHGQGVTSFYLHLSKFAVAEGAQVKKGELIGYVGSTGRSTAPHLHWALDVHGVPVNPSQWIEFKPCAPPAKPKRRR